VETESFSRFLGENNMNFVIILLFIFGCIAAYKAFGAEDPRQKKLYAFVALAIGGILFVLRNYVPK
jgi:hypothetical protein